MVGGITLSLIARVQANSSIAAVAPIRCPCIAFVEEILRDLLITKNRDPNLWMELSEVQRAGKNIVGYHLSRGEYFTLIGDFDNALNQFQFALSLSGNSFQTSETIMTKIKLARERLGRGRGL